MTSTSGSWYPPTFLSSPPFTLSPDTVAAMERLRTAPPTSEQFQAMTPATPNRDHQHGGMEGVGIVTQQLKSSMREGVNWEAHRLHPAGREALDMIAHKIGRILSGSNPHDRQHWEDVAGYAHAAMRTFDQLEGVER